MDLVNRAAQDWNAVVATKTPSNSLANNGIDLNVNAYQLTVDSLKYRNNVQRAFNHQLHAGGVKVVAAPEIPFPTDSAKDILANYYNYPAFGFPVVLWELGSVTVSGTYQQITANMRAWSSMPRYLAVADGLVLTGTSPNLTGTYNVTLVGFLKAKTVTPTPPEGAAPTNAGGPPQGMGGPGAPGGPPQSIGRGGPGGPPGGGKLGGRTD